MPFNEIDLKIDSGGDLVVSSNGDLKLATERETLEQDVMFRLKTDHADFTPSQYIGADLNSFVGEPNNRRTWNLVTDMVKLSLTQDGRIPASPLFVDTIPISINSVQVLVVISDVIGTETEPSVISKTLDLDVADTTEELITETDE